MDIKNEMGDFLNKNLIRSLVIVPSGVINLSSNDYLGIARNHSIKQAAHSAIDKYGVGSTGSRLTSGCLDIHAETEDKLAQFLEYESCIIFGSGFLANIGLISTLASRNDYVLTDKLAHASILDGARLSGANLKRFKHNDIHSLCNLLEQIKDKKCRKFIITESVFSMDGDIAPIKDIYQISRKFKCYFIVDEAHAIGVFGNTKPNGYCASINIKPDIVTGTFSKAFGSYGGFIACSEIMKQLLVNKARTFIFSTSLPPVCLQAALKALNIFDINKGRALLSKARWFYNELSACGLKLMPFASHIIPVIVGSNAATVELANKLNGMGLFVKPIRPPTVPENTARIRLSITANHSRQELLYASKAIKKAINQ